MLKELIGWLGLFILIICNIPQVITSIKAKSFEGLSISSIVLKLIGFILLLLYVMMDSNIQMPLILNYGLNSIFLLWILFIYVKRR
jgi:uncharacterized protein with PQ loop repeat